MTKKDKIIWALVALAFVVIVSVLYLFVLKNVDQKTFCEDVSDCICGGMDTKTGSCFIGNINYYDKHVNKSRVCPDFCGGIANNLEMRCENNTCVQRNKKF